MMSLIISEKLNRKFNMDGGGDSFKISLSLMKEKGSPRHPKKKFLDTGVKEMIPLVVVEGIPEDYHNVGKILERMNLNIKKNGGVFAMDIKLINIVLGIMTASSSYPCPYCEIFHDFKNPAPMRTIDKMW